MTKETIEKLVPDTSIIIEGLISKKIKSGELKVGKILIHEAVLSELEHQSNRERSTGFFGLEEISLLKDISNVEFVGIRPRSHEIQFAKLGEIDYLIRQYAFENDCTLITSDKVQAKVALSKGMHVIYVQPETSFRQLKLETFFDESTMSVHLRENNPAYAKVGMPGNWEFKEVREKAMTQKELQDISREIIEECKLRADGYIEIERPGSTIAQLGKYRIVITRPPFSDVWEITAVRPVKTLTINDYKFSDKLMNRISKQAEGILVAGSPGMGKSTFVQALAEFYAEKGKIVKTVEAPRDLVLSEKITQYAVSHADAQEIHDILLLSRPDYTIFDEMRNTSDFQLFADMRLAGVGMVGVVHATNPVDAIQRFLGRVEMGVIPQIIDTVIFIKNGTIAKVLGLAITVKVPTGMSEADLARPVVTVNDFESGKLEYEIYSYGEQTVVIPVTGEAKAKGIRKLAEDSIRREFEKFVNNVSVELTSDSSCVIKVPEDYVPKIIGKEGKTIQGLEDKLGIHIDVRAKTAADTIKEKSEDIPYQFKLKDNQVILYLESGMQDKDLDIYINEDYLLTAKSSKSAIIKIKRDNKIGKILANALGSGEKIIIKNLSQE